jgi:hypothetical protein
MYTSQAIMAKPSFKEGFYHYAIFKGGTLFVPIFGTLLHSRRQPFVKTTFAGAIGGKLLNFRDSLKS